MTTTNLSDVVRQIKENVTIPVVLFPGNSMQLDPTADALLFLSLISGRNPELLIGQHVVAAPIIRNAKLEVIPTGYMLINSGRTTSVAYISNTTPIPDDKYSLAACTAMAGEMLGLQTIYLDAGSGGGRLLLRAGRGQGQQPGRGQPVSACCWAGWQGHAVQHSRMPVPFQVG